MIDIDALENLAKAATPGPWEYREHDGSAAACNADGWVEAILPSGTQENADAAYCAAANPAAILALIAEVRALREDKARLDWIVGNRHMRVQGGDVQGWIIWDCGNGLTEASSGATYREAIDAARGAK